MATPDGKAKEEEDYCATIMTKPHLQMKVACVSFCFLTLPSAVM